jgi:hypothetical protein
MRRWLLLMMCITLAGAICPATARAEDFEKSLQTNREFRPGGTVGETISGTVGLIPRWNRVFTTDDADPACGTESLLSEFGKMSYVATRIEVTGTEDVNLELAVNGAGTDIEDTVLAVYCAPFSPLFPRHNLLAYDDDDGVGGLSAFSASDGVTLSPGEVYILVLSPFNWHERERWEFQIDLINPDVHTIDFPVELQQFSIE